VAKAATTTIAGPAMTIQTMPNDHQGLDSEVLGFEVFKFVSLLEFMSFFP
jgi:regulator of RNase E activity RraA